MGSERGKHVRSPVSIPSRRGKGTREQGVNRNYSQLIKYPNPVLIRMYALGLTLLSAAEAAHTRSPYLSSLCVNTL